MVSYDGVEQIMVKLIRVTDYKLSNKMHSFLKLERKC